MARMNSNTAPTGTKRADGVQDTPEALRLSSMPPTPEDFGPVGQSYWKLYCGMYLKMNNLSLAWLPAIENICRQHEYLALIQQALDEQGVMLIEWKEDRLSDGTKTGEAVPRSVCNPLYRDYLKAANQLHSHLNDMGGTPYSAKVASVGMGGAGDLAPKKGGKPEVQRPQAPATVGSPRTV